MNQSIRIEQGLSERRYEVYSDFMTDAYLSLNQLAVREIQKTNYRKRKCIRMDDEQSFFRRNGCFYKRKSKLDNHSYQEKMHSEMFKIIRIQSDLIGVVRIVVIFSIDVFAKLIVYADKDKINYKRRRNENNLYSRWLSLTY